MTTHINTGTAVSVITTVYNEEQYVAEAVQSILAQSFGDFEYIIIDDGSTDESVTLLERFSREDERIRLVRRPHIGRTRALNEALALARARFIAVMDANDMALPTRLAEQVRFLLEHSGTVCVGSQYETIDGDGRSIDRPRWPSDAPSIRQLLLAGRCAICHVTSMTRRRAVLAAGGYDNSSPAGHDFGLFLRLLDFGELCNLSSCLMRVRVKETGISPEHRPLQKRKQLDALEPVWKRLERAGNPEPSPAVKRRVVLKVVDHYIWAGDRLGAVRTVLRYAHRLSRGDLLREGLRCALPSRVFKALRYRVQGLARGPAAVDRRSSMQGDGCE